MTQQQYLEARQQALAYFEKAGIVLTEEEVEHFEVADFGLGDWRNVGLNLVTYVNTQRCCAKEMVLLPGQTCPQHTHVPFGDYPGKEETFRCRWGQVYLYVAGEPASPIRAQVPETGKDSYTVFHEIVLKPGQQYTLTPNTPTGSRAARRVRWSPSSAPPAMTNTMCSTTRPSAGFRKSDNVRKQPPAGLPEGGCLRKEENHDQQRKGAQCF